MVYSLHNLADAKPEVADYASEKPELVAYFKTLHEFWAKEVKPR
jgi:hypothetical protein